MHSIFHCNKCRAWYSCGTVMHEDLTQQEEGHVSYFTCLVARHLIKMLNVLMDDGEICAGEKKHDTFWKVHERIYLEDISGYVKRVYWNFFVCLGVGLVVLGQEAGGKNCLLIVVLYCFQFSQRFEVTFSCFSSNTAAKYNVLGSAWHDRKVLPFYASKKNTTTYL